MADEIRKKPHKLEMDYAAWIGNVCHIHWKGIIWGFSLEMPQILEMDGMMEI